jgi:hypothetical protein
MITDARQLSPRSSELLQMPTVAKLLNFPQNLCNPKIHDRDYNSHPLVPTTYDPCVL